MHSTEFGVIKSGVLQVVSFDTKYASRAKKICHEISHQKVVVVVYKTSSEHFAVLYPQWGLISAKRPFCIINLKRARVERSNKNPDTEFSISSNRDSGVLSLVLSSMVGNSGDDSSAGDDDEDAGNLLAVIDSWIVALQGECKDCDNSIHDGKCYSRRRVSKSSLLSVLNEDNEEYV